MRTEAVACCSAFIHKADALHKRCESWGTRDYDDTNWRTRISNRAARLRVLTVSPRVEKRDQTLTRRTGGRGQRGGPVPT